MESRKSNYWLIQLLTLSTACLQPPLTEIQFQNPCKNIHRWVDSRRLCKPSVQDCKLVWKRGKYIVPCWMLVDVMVSISSFTFMNQTNASFRRFVWEFWKFALLFSEQHNFCMEKVYQLKSYYVKLHRNSWTYKWERSQSKFKVDLVLHCTSFVFVQSLFFF